MTPPSYSKKVVDPAAITNLAIEPLTQRETSIIGYIVLGYRDKDIAKLLFLSWHTIKTHVQHIYVKLNVANRVQAAVKWERIRARDRHHATQAQVPADRQVKTLYVHPTDIALDYYGS